MQYAVLGAGNGGQTLASVLRSQGYSLRLWNRSGAVIAALRERGKIVVTGAVSLEVPADFLTMSLEEALAGTDVALWTVPAHAHRALAEAVAPYVTADQIHILNPGRTGGALEVWTVFHRLCPERVPVVAETQSLLYACRTVAPGSVELLHVKPRNVVSCLPSWRMDRVSAAMAGIYAGLECRDSTFDTSIENIGAILHPVPALLNTGWIERPETPFLHYFMGISPTIARLLERIDAERVSVAGAYGISTLSVLEWHNRTYGSDAATLYDALQSNSGYAAIAAPTSMAHRYVHEDVPTGLVPIAELGRNAGVPTPLTDLAIRLADELLGTDYRHTGRTLHRLGLDGLSVDECVEVFAGRRSPA
jgi:opine dehydrogenase